MTGVSGSFLTYLQLLFRGYSLEQLFSVLFSANRGTPKHGEWMVACLKGVWPKLLGEKLAAVCQPVRFEDSKLTVEITNSEWAEAVKSVRPALLTKLRATTAGEVKTIAIVSRRPKTENV